MEDANQQDDRGELLRRHREVSDTIRRTMLALLAFTLFCWLTLGSQDRLLIVGDETIKVPFVDVPLSFPAFLFVAPFLLVILCIYLHVFFEELLRLEAAIGSGTDGRQAVLFNFSHPAAQRLTTLIFYFLVPLTLGAIAWKALARVEWGLPVLAVTIAVTANLACVQHLRSPNRVWSFRTVRCFYGALAIVLIMACLVASIKTGFLSRPLNLYRADLPNAWLLSAQLENADLEFANLNEANLRKANLSKANLSKANLVDTDLTGADLSGANLSDANLRDPNRGGAVLSKANLSRAKLEGTDLRKANLSGAKLEGTDLRKANLSGANFSGANLEDTDLSGANLSGANLNEANLSGAKLKSANLRGTILTKTTISKETELDAKWHLVREIVIDGSKKPERSSLPPFRFSNWSNKPNVSEGKLSYTNLSGANLSGLDLSEVDLHEAMLVDTNLSETDLSDAKLKSARLDGANLFRADLSTVDLRFALLQKADLRESRLKNAKLDYVNLTSADLSGADLSGAELKGDYFQTAIFCKTRMPDGSLCHRDCSDEMSEDKGCLWLEREVRQ